VDVVKTRKRTNRTDLRVTSRLPAGWLQPEQRLDFHEKELNMKNDDRIYFETREKMNELESYIYNMRDRLSGALGVFITPKDRETFTDVLHRAENWLYDQTEAHKSVFIAKLTELHAYGDPVERRYNESIRRDDVVRGAFEVLAKYRSAATSSDGAYSHIDESKKQTVVNRALECEAWLQKKIAHQSTMLPFEDPELTIASIEEKIREFESVAKPILSEPKPAPPKPTTPPPAAATATPETAGPTSSDPMDTSQ